MAIQPSSGQFHFVNPNPFSISAEEILPYPSYPQKPVSIKTLKTKTFAPLSSSSLPVDIAENFPHLGKTKTKLKGRAAA